MRLIAATLTVLILPASVCAHHSTRAFYDRDATVEIEGVVADVFWRNPHVGLTLIVEDEQGATQRWELEGGAMNTLERRGFSGESVKLGDHVRVAGAPSRRTQTALFVTHFLLPNGEEIIFTDRPEPLRWTEQQESSPDASVDSRSAARNEDGLNGIFRVWSAGGRYQLRAPLSLTPAAHAAQESWDPVTDDPSLRCESPGMPNAILNPYPIEFIDEGDRIRLRIEEWDAVRVIHMSTEEPPRNVNLSRLGYSRGLWEGRTLVVETSRLNGPYLDDSGTPQSENAEIVERFSLSADETRLDYEIIITDQENLVEPAIWEAAWIWEPGAEVKPFECALR